MLKQLRKEILAAVQHGLFPDSDVSLRNPSTKEYKLYKLKWAWHDSNVEFEEASIETSVNLATAAAIEVTTHFHKPPKNGWEGCVHLHT